MAIPQSVTDAINGLSEKVKKVLFVADFAAEGPGSAFSSDQFMNFSPSAGSVVRCDTHNGIQSNGKWVVPKKGIYRLESTLDFGRYPGNPGLGEVRGLVAFYRNGVKDYGGEPGFSGLDIISDTNITYRQLNAGDVIEWRMEGKSWTGTLSVDYIYVGFTIEMMLPVA